METATKARIDPADIDSYEEIHGRGVIARTSDGDICAGRSEWLMEMNPDIGNSVAQVEEMITGMSSVHVMRDGQYLGAVGLEDKLRRNAVIAVDRDAGDRMSQDLHLHG